MVLSLQSNTYIYNVIGHDGFQYQTNRRTSETALCLSSECSYSLLSKKYYLKSTYLNTRATMATGGREKSSQFFKGDARQDPRNAF
jgi:hypothetical protein